MNKLDLYPFTMIPLNIGENLSKSIEKVRNKIILMKKSINNFNETSYNSFSLSKIKIVTKSEQINKIKQIGTVKNNLNNKLIKFSNVYSDKRKSNFTDLISQKRKIRIRNDQSKTDFEPYQNNSSVIITGLDNNDHDKRLNPKTDTRNKHYQDESRFKLSPKGKSSIILPKLNQSEIYKIKNRIIPSINILTSNESSFSPILDNIDTISPIYPIKILEIKDKLSYYHRIAKSQILNSENISTKLENVKSKINTKLISILKDKDSDELAYLKGEQKNISKKPIFLFTSDGRKIETVSTDKNNLYKQTEFINRTNSQAVYKFKNLIYEKFGKKDIYDEYIDPFLYKVSHKKNKKLIDNHLRVKSLMTDISNIGKFIETHTK